MPDEIVYGFDETGFRRVQEEVRRSRGTPLTGSQRRRQVPVIGSGPLDDDDRPIRGTPITSLQDRRR